MIVVSQEESKKEVEIPVGAIGVTDQAEVVEVFGKEVELKIKEGVMSLELVPEAALLFKIEL